MRDDVLHAYPAIDPDRVHVVHNGIDTDDCGRPMHDPDRVRSLGVDPDRPSVVFVGRITRQKGLPLFLRAVAQLPPDVQVVLCAGAPDTPEIEAEVMGLVDGLRESRDGVVWIREMLPRADVVALLTAATVFACPSIYEPLGIVNLEAMACETAVVATATGGIPEVVVDPHSGWASPTARPPAGWCRSTRRATAPAPRSTRTGTWPTSPPRSPRWSPTPAGPPRWARPGASGRSTRSAGPRSPSGPWRSTARSSEGLTWPVDDRSRDRRSTGTVDA